MASPAWRAGRLLFEPQLLVGVPNVMASPPESPRSATGPDPRAVDFDALLPPRWPESGQKRQRQQADAKVARPYSKWEANGSGGYSKQLCASDMLKLRLKGGIMHDCIKPGVTQAYLVLKADVAHNGTAAAAATPPPWAVGIWRPKTGSLDSRQQVCF